MYLIEFRTKYESHMLSTEYKSVFAITWMLEHDNSVVQFKVSNGNYLLWNEFGYGKFNKWVTAFTYDKYP